MLGAGEDVSGSGAMTPPSSESDGVEGAPAAVALDPSPGGGGEDETAFPAELSED